MNKSCGSHEKMLLSNQGQCWRAEGKGGNRPEDKRIPALRAWRGSRNKQQRRRQLTTEARNVEMAVYARGSGRSIVEVVSEADEPTVNTKRWEAGRSRGEHAPPHQGCARGGDNEGVAELGRARHYKKNHQ